ncbi:MULTISPECIES: hypothetical protein [unclassified Novosphingobium]|uniref:hypothetical protein n=1 Tax=unclassified Novosphingobium TaxID=2644732 RepID=UPI001494E933|nr:MULTISPECIES: hypothetical protein [unclassified Novosphingobium]MBB3357040.1 hypothetical protein [Novosphingobium sp. BK256]MBB3373441.1 hypothetical protein [Novosphingobium sp. BK280]MBB3377810.1 hypothetical protein [Novosphingobium sp. BK258]MBB3418779.1 hypothetical protein [Novosphingobium sp. BK267]MBB3450386.1 hypothetical protein [Novosphingobium sp. BK352]
MIQVPPPEAAQPRRATLATYENAYAVAVQMRRATGRPQFVLRTENPLQPFRVTSIGPARRQSLLTLIA